MQDKDDQLKNIKERQEYWLERKAELEIAAASLQHEIHEIDTTLEELHDLELEVTYA